MKTGMDRATGRESSGLPYLRQRLADVVNTPIGSIVGRREFGSRFFELVDRNVDDSFYMDAYVRLAEAINNPANGLDDFKLRDMRLNQPGEHHVEIAVTGVLLVDGQTLDVTFDDTHGVMWNGRH